MNDTSSSVRIAFSLTQQFFFFFWLTFPQRPPQGTHNGSFQSLVLSHLQINSSNSLCLFSRKHTPPNVVNTLPAKHKRTTVALMCSAPPIH
jgi:hypothetical protein